MTDISRIFNKERERETEESLTKTSLAINY